MTLSDFITVGPETNLTLAVDRSLSMAYDRKLERAKQLSVLIASEIRGNRALGLMAFDHIVETLLPLTSTWKPGDMATAMDRVRERGTTNMAVCLRAAGESLDGEPGQVVLLTDGRVNTALDGSGSEGDAEVEREIREIAAGLADRKVVVSAVALGEDSFISVLDTIVASTGGALRLDLDGQLESVPNLSNVEVEVQGIPEELPSGKPTWSKELNVKHVTVASADLCEQFAEDRIAFVTNLNEDRRARVSLLSIDDPLLLAFSRRAPKTTSKIRESRCLLLDSSYRRTLGVERGDRVMLWM